MGVKVKSKDFGLGKLEKTTKGIDGKGIQCGVLGEQAWLAAIHEYGCRIKVTPKMRAYLHYQGLHLKESTEYIVIPERSFLRSGFDENEKDILKKTDNLIPELLAGTMSEAQFCKTVGLLMKSAIQDYARDLRNPPNHPFTVEQKGSSNPLIDTGDMIGSVDYEVTK